MATDYKLEFHFADIESIPLERLKNWADQLLTFARINKVVALNFGSEYRNMVASGKRIGYKVEESGKLKFVAGFFRKDGVAQLHQVEDESLDILLLSLLMVCEIQQTSVVTECTVPPRLMRKAFKLASYTFPTLERPRWVPDEPELQGIEHRPDHLDFKA